MSANESDLTENQSVQMIHPSRAHRNPGRALNQPLPPSHPSPRAPLSVFGYPLPEWEHVEL